MGELKGLRIVACQCLLLVTGVCMIMEVQADGQTPSAITVLTKAKASPGHDVLNEIDDIDKMGRTGDTILVDLLDYYIGEGPQILLEEAITRRGKRMLPALHAAKKRPPRCDLEFSVACHASSAETLELRQARLDLVINAIRKGKILCAEFDNCPRNR